MYKHRGQGSYILPKKPFYSPDSITIQVTFRITKTCSNSPSGHTEELV